MPQSRAKKPRKSSEERAREQGLTPEQIGKTDGERFAGFVWKVAGRPADAAPDWKRERPLFIALDTYLGA